MKTKETHPMVASLMADIKVITDDYTAPAKPTFKMKVKRTVEDEVEVSLPFYRIDNCHAYMVYSNDRCVQVCHSLEEHLSIQIVGSNNAFVGGVGEDCTESEFLAAYNKTLQKINETIFSVEI